MPNVRLVPSPALRRRLLKGCATYFLNVRPDLAALPIVPITVPAETLGPGVAEKARAAGSSRLPKD